MRSGFDRRDDLFLFLRRVTRRRVGEHIAHDLGRVRCVVHECLRANRDLVTEERGDLVCVPCATYVAQQRDPVDRFGQLRIEAGLLADR